MIVGLNKPLVFFDIEGTGLSPERDRIVSLAMFKVRTQISEGEWWQMIFNPGVEMSAEIIAVHGITNEMACLEPPFPMFAKEVHDFIKGCDLAGYNLLNYDVPMLWEELYRAGITWDLTDCRTIDVGNIFKKKEQRSLEAAVEFYCGHKHEDAHDARADTYATVKVLESQLSRYNDLSGMTVGELSEFSKLDKFRRVDLAGKIAINDNGEYVYGLHSKRGIRIKDDPSFGEWMLKKDFPENTKMHLRRILDEVAPPLYDPSDLPIDSDDMPSYPILRRPIVQPQRQLLSPHEEDDPPF